MQLHFYTHQSHFHKNGFALRLALKQRYKGTRKWPIKATVTKVQSFIDSCLWRILKVHWPDKISNISLWVRTQQIPAEREIGRKKSGWV